MSKVSFGAAQISYTGGGDAVPLSGTSLLVRQLIIVNEVAGPTYFGASNVSSADGLQLPVGVAIKLGDLPEGGVDQIDLSELYVRSVTSNGTVTIFYIR